MRRLASPLILPCLLMLGVVPLHADQGRIHRCATSDDSFGEVVDEFVAPMLRQSPHVPRTYKALAVAARMGGAREHLEDVELSHFARNWMHDDHWAALEAFLNRSRE